MEHICPAVGILGVFDDMLALYFIKSTRVTEDPLCDSVHSTKCSYPPRENLKWNTVWLNQGHIKGAFDIQHLYMQYLLITWSLLTDDVLHLNPVAAPCWSSNKTKVNQPLVLLSMITK